MQGVMRKGGVVPVRSQGLSEAVAQVIFLTVTSNSVTVSTQAPVVHEMLLHRLFHWLLIEPLRETGQGSILSQFTSEMRGESLSPHK